MCGKTERHAVLHGCPVRRRGLMGGYRRRKGEARQRKDKTGSGRGTRGATGEPGIRKGRPGRERANRDPKGEPRQ